MTTALTLYQRHSQSELVSMQEAIQAAPTSRNTKGGIHIYTETARRKLSQIAEAITHHLADKRAAAGRPVATDGYSGRQQNRRR